jgi:hypothetical protein
MADNQHIVHAIGDAIISMLESKRRSNTIEINEGSGYTDIIPVRYHADASQERLGFEDICVDRIPVEVNIRFLLNTEAYSKGILDYSLGVEIAGLSNSFINLGPVNAQS